MATITAGTSFPTELVREMFNNVGGHSSVARLSDAKPLPFNGETVMVFSNAGEASLVAEGAAKPAGNASVEPVVIRPQKFVYQQRVSDEFVKNAESKLNYLQSFAEGFGRVIARGLDIAAIHGIDPATKADIPALATNNIDDLVAAGSIITYDSTAPDGNIDDAVAAIQALGGSVSGIAMSPAFSAALASLKVNGVPQFPEYRFGQNPDALYGMRSDVNTTINYTGSAVGAPTDYAVIGDFARAFRWGYSVNVPLEVIEYGDPDGAGHDLKQYNEVLLRAEAYIGWGILDAGAFAVVR
jgi:HK97 family phage major capsid protein